MTWLDYLSPPHGSEGQLLPDGLAAAGTLGIEIMAAPEPGPIVEVRDLFKRLYGDPQDCQPPSPYTASYRRLRAKLRPTPPESGQGEVAGTGDEITGSIEFRYWPKLKLGYIENVHVGPEVRRQGLGVHLLNFAVDHMRRQGSRRVYAFTVSPDGLGLFTSAGFAAEPPEEATEPWRCWVSLEHGQSAESSGGAGPAARGGSHGDADSQAQHGSVQLLPGQAGGNRPG